MMGYRHALLVLAVLLLALGAQPLNNNGNTCPLLADAAGTKEGVTSQRRRRQNARKPTKKVRRYHRQGDSTHLDPQTIATTVRKDERKRGLVTSRRNRNAPRRHHRALVPLVTPEVRSIIMMKARRRRFRRRGTIRRLTEAETSPPRRKRRRRRRGGVRVRNLRRYQQLKKRNVGDPMELPITGGYAPVTDFENIVDAANFVLEELRTKENEKMLHVSMYTVAEQIADVRVVEASKQVVAGLNIRLILVFRDSKGSCLGASSVVIYDHFGDRSLTKWEEEDCEELESLPDIGVIDFGRVEETVPGPDTDTNPMGKDRTHVLEDF